MKFTVVTREALLGKVVELASISSQYQPMTNVSSRSGDVLNGAIHVSLETVREASKIVPAIPLQGAAAAALALWDIVLTTKDNKKNLLRLANDCLELSMAIIAQYYDAATKTWRSDVPHEHDEAIFRFIEQAYSICLQAEALRKRPWFIRFLSAKLDAGTIDVFRETLNQATDLFIMGNILAIRRNTQETLNIVSGTTPPIPTQISLSPVQVPPRPSQVSHTEAMADTTTIPPSAIPLGGRMNRESPVPPTVTQESSHPSAEPPSYPFQRTDSGTINSIVVGQNYSNKVKVTDKSMHNSGNNFTYDARGSFNFKS